MSPLGEIQEARQATDAPAPAPSVVWCLTDGRPGHRSQLEGLVAQLARRRKVATQWIDVGDFDGSTFLTLWRKKQFPPGETFADPRLIIAAGHATHLAALAARRARGGKTVVLMRPSLPSGLFDLCLIPEHDLRSGFGRFNRFSVVATRGVLNPLSAVGESDASRALVLIGGPSRHHGWSEDDLIAQLQELLRLSPVSVRWVLTTSRRTPTPLTERLHTLCNSNPQGPQIQVMPFPETGPGWLYDQLANVATAFVTEDSISMIYEALTAGADVGLLRVPRRRRSRVIRGIDRLAAERFIIPFEQWRTSRFEDRRRETFNEAARCAEIVCRRLLDAA